MSDHTYHGVTITLAGSQTAGSYVTGEPYIILSGATSLTAIDNPSFQGYGTCSVIGGSMKNPSGIGGQGFTNQYVTDSPGSHVNYYDSTKNVGVNLPISVSPGDMLLVSIARNDTGSKVGIHKIVCFSFVAAAPPERSFRPGFYGTDRSLAFTEFDIKKDTLKSIARTGLTAVPSVSYMSDINRFPALPWFTWGGGWDSTVIMPQVNCANKNDENTSQGSSYRFSMAAMWLNLDFTYEQKRTLLLKIIQNGIDLASFFAAGGTMHGGGSHQTGYKMPLFFAAVLLDNAQMLGYSRDPDISVEGARSTWRINASDVGRTADNGYSFLESEVGTYWWGMNHIGSPNLDYPPNSPSRYPYYTELAKIFPSLVVARLWGKTSDFGWGINYHYMLEYIARHGYSIVDVPAGFFSSFWDAVWPTLPSLASETTPLPAPLRTSIIEPGQSLSLKPDPWGHPVRYTTNGDTPTSGSAAYTAPITGISASTTLKAKSFPADYQDPSATATIAVTVIANGTPAPPSNLQFVP